MDLGRAPPPGRAAAPAPQRPPQVMSGKRLPADAAAGAKSRLFSPRLVVLDLGGD